MAFTVTYNGNGSTGGSVPVDSTAYASGAQVTVMGNTGGLAKAGAAFGFWNTAADGTGNGGVTTHYTFSYHENLKGPAGPEPARLNSVIQACETDYTLMSRWFGSTGVTGMKVQVTPRSNGAHWFGSNSSSTVRLYPGGASYTNDPVYLRYLMVSEVTEIFMMNQAAGWFQGGDEG